MGSPTISIIIPVYNVESQLLRCLESIHNQTFTDFEAILIDDGSTDNCGYICEQYTSHDKRFLVIHTQNRGLSMARNIGIDNCSGKFITFVDSDDFIAQNMLEEMVSAQQKTGADIVAVDSRRVKTINDIPTPVASQLSVVTGADVLPYFVKSCLKFYHDNATAWGKLYKRELFTNIRFQAGKTYEDIITIFCAVAKCTTYTISNSIGYYYCVNNTSITRSRFTAKDFDLLEAYNYLLNISGENKNSNEVQRLLQIAKTRCYFTLLGKIARFGIEPNLDENAIVKDFIYNLRVNFKKIYGIAMPLNRRIILVLICYISWPLAKRCIRCWHYLQKKIDHLQG